MPSRNNAIKNPKIITTAAYFSSFVSELFAVARSFLREFFAIIISSVSQLKKFLTEEEKQALG